MCAGLRALGQRQACRLCLTTSPRSSNASQQGRTRGRQLRVHAAADRHDPDPVGTASSPEGKKWGGQGAVFDTGVTADPQPGYPLELVAPVWIAIAGFAYSVAAVVVLNDQLLPEQLRAIIYAIFRNHQNIVNIGLGAVAIHVGYVFVAISTSRSRDYDARATAFWAVSSFVFGFLGLRMLLDKKQ